MRRSTGLRASGWLVFETSLLSEVEKYGNCLTHPRSYIDVWTELQTGGQVAADAEYEEYPRAEWSATPGSTASSSWRIVAF
jgi:hypothetical protein